MAIFIPKLKIISSNLVQLFSEMSFQTWEVSIRIIQQETDDENSKQNSTGSLLDPCFSKRIESSRMTWESGVRIKFMRILN